MLICLLSTVASQCFSAENTLNEENVLQQITQLHSERLNKLKFKNFDLTMLPPIGITQSLDALNCPLQNSQITEQGENIVGKVTFSILCNSATGTSSAELTFDASLKLPIVVTKHPIAANKRLTASDLMFISQDISSLHTGYYLAMEQVIGFDVRRALPANKVLNSLLIQPPLLIEKGDEVTVIADLPGLSIRTTGIALTSGRKNKQISVKNSQSGKVVRVRVIDIGLVEII